LRSCRRLAIKGESVGDELVDREGTILVCGEQIADAVSMLPGPRLMR
jgi:hypothetical protein